MTAKIKTSLSTETKVKEGYKKTKLGWIPEEWKVYEFGEFACKSKSKSNIKEGDKCVELEHINQINGSINGYDNSGTLKSSKNVFVEGDVLFGKLRPYLRKFWLATFDGFSSSEIWVLKGINNKCSSSFLFFLIQSHKFIQVANTTSGTKMPRADWNYVANFPFPLPPLPEQKKIADILSTWDKAIETTQALIKKLQLRKKGLMQQLLTGKKRLPGFSGEWEFIKASELFANHTDKSHNGEFEVLSATQDQGVIPRSQTGIDIKYDKSSLKNYKKIDEGDFVISLRSFQGGIEYSKYLGLVSPAYTVLKEKQPIDKVFYIDYFKTDTFIQRLNSIIYGIRDGKQISYRDFSSLKLHYPPVEEQVAIGWLITKSDEEINQTQNYLNHLQEQKKGLMQQLLTGQKKVTIN